ncbi:type I polyketide synthase [Actinomadura decatromicini]|uniref:type I polyketide synthase n=1 Tax=Actinomadura decatromicini TaxID=2604572 RepID=UPI001CA350EF|nr:type I polyketide synthase [Actinomadura decatromicini]
MTPFGRPVPGLAVAVARAGGTGVLDLGADRAAALTALADVRRWWTGTFGVRVPAGCRVRPGELPDAVDTVLVDAPLLRPDGLVDLAGFARGRRLVVEVVGPAEAAAALHVARGLGGDVALIARGSEAGGRVGGLSTFVLLQRLLADPSVDVPVYAAGGIGAHSAAAAVAGGAAGVVLDVQLALVREMDLPAGVVSALTAMDGGETAVVDGHRVYTPPAAGPSAPARLGAQPLPVGQDGPLAAALGGRYKTAGGVVRAVLDAIDAHLRAAVRAEPLARRDGADPVVVQGPMAHVSDGSAFAGAVAQDGGLPFLALARMDGDRVRHLLRETASRLGGRPWGVGVLGFAPPEVRDAQLAAVRESAPPYALIAGGGPAEAEPLEAAGIRTYLHVPSPDLLDRYLAGGVRRFVFEGGECGGHAGPRASLPLWDAQVERLTESGIDPAELSVMFAGGIHDERSAAMAAALAGPLAERGADVRVLMGTAYLFTSEAVAAGAILPGFQDVALGCDTTVLLETSPGHAVRCARTPYVDTFYDTRRELEQAGTPPQEVRRRLEKLNLARLRVAGKGLRRATPVDAAAQRSDGMFMMGEVAALRTATTGVAALHEQVTSGATAFLAARAAELGVGRSAPAAPARPVDVAIIGIGCVLPGAADADAYWANVVGGVDSVTEVTRWDPEIYHGPSGEERTPSKWGGFVPDVPFDALAHGIAPDALGGVEPVQLLALEVAVRALRDAGYADRPFDRSRTSVVFGAGGGGDLGDAYGMRAALPSYYGEVPPALDARLPRPTEHSLPGALTGVIAAQIANRLGLGGASHTVDAAGAASLAALDAACKDLAAGSGDMVLCGGADLRTGIRDYLLFASAGALSPSGRCAAFDASADGVALGEGAACVVLKRLADAERDGDRIYAVVKSVAGAGDGHAAGGRRLALGRAYERAGVPPASVGLVEAHGTGAEADDRAELAALNAVFADAAPGAVTLGSVTSQIGHTGCAAGLAGLIKTAYALHTGVLPGTLHLSEPNAAWTPDGPLAFGAAARPWAVAPGERHAGVSGSGFGGATFHAVLSGYGGAPEPVSGLAEWPAELFLIRAADRAAARDEIDRLLALLDGDGGPPRLRDLARTAAALDGPVQAAVVATGPDDLRRALTAAAEFRAEPGVFVPSGEPGQVAFLFPGEGGERPNMLAGLFVAFPRLQRLLRLDGGRHAPAMFPPAAFTSEDVRRQDAAITDTRAAQPALGIAGLAVHRLLTALSVHPDLAAGHGYGELVALCAAGVFDDADLIELSSARAEALLAAAGDDPGAMAAVAAPLHAVRELLAGLPDVVVAGHDAPRQVVIAGTSAGLERALAVLSGAGAAAERLPAACAFHSPLVGAASAVLRAELARRDLRSPAFPVWANTTAAPYDADPAELAVTLAGQLATPVRFVEQVEAMYAAGARVFVEAGPGRVLTGLVGEILGERPHTAVSCDAPGENALTRFLYALAELAGAGVLVDPLPLFAGRDARALSGTPAPAPGWIVNGHLVRTADGGYPPGALRPAERVQEDGGSRGSEAAVLEYLRAGREMIAAQREVILRHLGAIPPAAPEPEPGPGPADVPAPRPVLPGETLPGKTLPGETLPGEALPAPVEAPRDDYATVPEAVTAPTGHSETMAEAVAFPAPVVPAQAPGPEPTTRPGVVRQVPRVVELDALPRPPESGTAFTGRGFQIVDDGCGVALELAVLLERHGAHARTVHDVEPDADHRDGLVHLAALRPGEPGVLPRAYGGIRRALAGGLRWLAVASGAGGTFGRRFAGGGIGDPAPGAGLGGLARTIALEHPEVHVRALDVDTKETPRAIAQRILAELLNPDGPVVVGHEGERRNGLSVVPADLDGDPVPPVEPDGVVLLTGGARGVTARLALELARTSGCHLEIIGRTPEPRGEPAFPDAPDEPALRRTLVAEGNRQPAEIEATIRTVLVEREMRRNLDALRRHAASVRYHAADARDPNSVRGVVDNVYLRHGRLDGVVHGAGVVEERLVRDKSPESFDRVFRTKVDGACALAQAVRPDLGFLVVLGSVAGVHGGRGQADHAAANDACDTLAHVWRTRLRGRVLVADWGPWAGGGPAAPEPARRGTGLIDPDAGAAALLREIAHGHETQVVFTGAVR